MSTIPRLMFGITAGLILVGLLSSPAGAYAPAFAGGDFILANRTKMDVGMDACPRVVDWNEDGKKDLLMGDYDGYAGVCLNQGTNAEPVFTDFEPLLVEGKPIRVGSG